MRTFVSTIQYTHNNEKKQAKCRITMNSTLKKKYKQLSVRIKFKTTINGEEVIIYKKQKWKPITLSCYGAFVQHLVSTLTITSPKIDIEAAEIFNIFMSKYFIGRLKNQNTYHHIHTLLFGI